MSSAAWGPVIGANTNPSRWSRRFVLEVLALAGFVVASYLGAYQLGYVRSVWDPMFGSGSIRVLHSPMERLLPVPDAALGAAAYLAEFVAGLLGGGDRWRRQPWAVLVFGAVVAALAATAVVLASLQAFVYHEFCTLCLLSAAISLLVAALAVEEILATIRWLRTETGLGRPLLEAIRDGEPAGWRGSAAVRHHRLGGHRHEAGLRGPGVRGNQTSGKETAAMTDDIEGAAHGGTDWAVGDPDDKSGPAAGDPAAGDPAADPGPGSSAADRGPGGSTAPSSAASNPNPPGELPNRPGGADVDGGDERMWRGPDRSTGEKGERSGVVVVSGAAAGVGRATVREFAKHGYDVGLIARSRESLENARAEVESCGGRAVVCALDVADADAVEQAAAEIEAQLGPIDVWVNDAMVSVFSPVKEMKAEEFRRVTEVNYLGYVHGTLAALKRMLPRDRGVIVHVGSALAYRSIPLQSAYCATKHAILGFHESLRTELLHDGSRVQTVMVQMPALNTPQFDWVKSRLPDKPQPVPPIYQPEVAAEAIYWAAQHPRREVIVGATTWGAINLNKLIPAGLDWYLSKTGFKSQQTGEPDDPNRRDNLWQPVPGDHGAHGRFDSRSVSRSTQVWATTHRPIVAGAAAAVGLLALGGLQAVTSLMRPGRRGR